MDFFENLLQSLDEVLSYERGSSEIEFIEETIGEDDNARKPIHNDEPVPAAD